MTELRCWEPIPDRTILVVCLLLPCLALGACLTAPVVTDPVEAVLCAPRSGRPPAGEMGARSREVLRSLENAVEKALPSLLLLPEYRARVVAPLPAEAKERLVCATYRGIRGEAEAPRRADLLLQLAGQVPEGVLVRLLEAVADVALEMPDADRQKSLLLAALRRIVNMRRPDASLSLLDRLSAAADRIPSMEVRGWVVYARAIALAHAGERPELLPLLDKLYRADASFPEWKAGGWGIGQQDEPLRALVLHLAECGFTEQAEHFVEGGLKTWLFIFRSRPSPPLLAKLLELARIAPSEVWQEVEEGKLWLARAVLDLPRPDVPAGFREWLEELMRDLAASGRKWELSGLHFRILLAGGVGPEDDAAGRDRAEAASALWATMRDESVLAEPRALLAQLPGRDQWGKVPGRPVVDLLMDTGLAPPPDELLEALDTVAAVHGPEAADGCGMPDQLALLAWAHLALRNGRDPPATESSARILEECVRGMADRWSRSSQESYAAELEVEVLRPLSERREQELVDRLLVALFDLRDSELLRDGGLRTLQWRYGTWKARKACMEHLVAELDGLAAEYGIHEPCGAYGDEWTNRHEELLDLAMELHLDDPQSAAAGIRRALALLGCPYGVRRLDCGGAEPVVRLLEAKAALELTDGAAADDVRGLAGQVVREQNPRCWTWLEETDRQPGPLGVAWWKKAIERRFSSKLVHTVDRHRIRYDVARYVRLSGRKGGGTGTGWVLDGYRAGIRLARDAPMEPEERVQILVSLLELVAAAEESAGTGGER